MNEDWIAEGKDRRYLVSLLFKAVSYYLVLFGLVFLLLKIFPSFLPYLPVGGVGELSGGADLEISRLKEDPLLSGYDVDLAEPSDNVQQTSHRNVSIFYDAQTLFVSMLGTLLLMFPVAWVFKAVHRLGEHDHSLDETILILPSVVAGIVIIVQHSLALAFSIAGIVAGVQFRRALTDTIDTLFIFVSIAVGIAAGIRALDIASVITVFFTVSILFICLFGDGLESQHAAERKAIKLREKAAADAESTNQDKASPPGPLG